MSLLLLATCICCGEAKSGDWEYQYQVENPGTRSEYIIGKLLFKGKELPKKYEHMITPIGEFYFSKGLGWTDTAPRWLPATEDAKGVRAYFLEAEVKEVLSGKKANFRTTASEDQTSIKIEKRPANAAGDWFYAVKQRSWINPKEAK